ncbi:MAG TPA: glycine cleavage system protein GcvH [Phycisphaerae bacterium]|nr:glycine cleavage system protein GcvH [Phycisphaerae bacterium]
MNAPKDLLYTDQHEWIRIEGAVGTVGITDYAQEALGDITYAELPTVGKQLAKGAEAGAVESCKAASSIYSPVSGKVTDLNAALEADPALLNREPYSGGWMFKIELSSPDEAAELMDAAAYTEFCQKEAH